MENCLLLVDLHLPFATVAIIEQHRSTASSPVDMDLVAMMSTRIYAKTREETAGRGRRQRVMPSPVYLWLLVH